MASFEVQLLQRLDDIERRIARLEGSRGGRPVPDNAPPEAVPPVIQRAAPPVEIQTPPPAPPTAPSAQSRKFTALQSVLGGRAGDAGEAPASEAEAPPVVLAAASHTGSHPEESAWAAHEEPAPARMTLESWIGGRWFAVLGAIAVLIAIGLFLKLAYDRAWLAQIPPAARCLIGAAFGVLLLGGGEVARRKINAWASAGLSSAGVAGIYASVLAAYGLFDLLGDAPAFVLLAATSALGVAVAARARLAVVAMVSIVGAYMAPFLLSPQDPNPLVFPAYLLAILGAGLTLSAWLRAAFRVVGSLVWWGTLALGGMWVLWEGGKHPAIALGLLSGAWAMVHAAHLFATRGGPEPTDDDVPAARLLPPIHEVWMIASSFTFSTWAAGLAVFTLQRGTGLALPDWLPPIGLAGATCVMAMTIAGRLRVLTDVPMNGRERLGAALVMQTGGLLIAGIVLLVTGQAAVLVWLALGLGAVLAGRWIGSRGLDVYGVIVLLIGSGRWVFYESWASGMTAAWRELAGLVLSQWMLFGVIAGAVWTIAALVLAWRRGPAGDKPRPLAMSAMVLGLLCFLAAMAHAEAAGTSVAIAWLGIGTAGVLTGPRVRQVLLRELSVGVLGAAVLGLIAWEGLAGRSVGAPGTEVMGLVAGQWMVACALAAAAWLVAGLAVSGREARSPFDRVVPAMAGCAAVVMLLLAPMHEAAERASILWVWLGVTGAALAAEPLRRALRLGAWSLAAGGMCAALWTHVYIPEPWFDWTGSEAKLLLHPGLWSALACAALLAATGRWGLHAVQDPGARAARIACAAGALLLVFAASSLEVGRVAAALAGDRTVRFAALSIWWGLFAIALIVGGFARVTPPARHAGLGLMMIAAVKVVLFDLGDRVTDVWRIASFLLLGLFMIGVAAGYSMLAGKLTKRQ